MLSKEEFEKLSSKQDELRKIRNDYADKQQEIQKQIDSLEIQKYDVERFIGKIIVIKDLLGAVYHTYEYMVVDRVERLYLGPRFYGKTISVVYSNSTKIGNSLQLWERSEYSSCKWDKVDSIEIVEPEKVKKQINNMLNIFDYGEELNKLRTKRNENNIEVEKN